MNKQKGFTLIELLVVIAIIGILAAIVFVNVGSARNKAKDAAVKGNLSEMMLAVETAIDAGTITDYSGACTAGSVAYEAAKTQRKTSGTFDCDGTATAPAGWRACVQLSNPTAPATNGWWCVDSTGMKKEVSTTCAGTSDTTCP